MREIDFRVWDKQYKCFCLQWGTLEFLSRSEDCTYTFGKLIDSDFGNYIIQEYTGIKDKNGRKVYEGDIVKFSYERYEHDWEHDEGEVYFEDGIFFFGKNVGLCLADSNLRKESIEVIGHINDNIKNI